MGAPLIAARFPRAFLDVNREPYELDPELFIEPLPDFANTQSVRVVGRARHHRPHRRRRRGDLSLAAAARRRPAAHRAALYAVPRRAGRADRGRRAALRVCDPHRLPFDAVGLDGAGRRAAPRLRPRRPLRGVVRLQAHPLPARRAQPGSATRCRSTGHMPAATSPSTTDGPHAACTRCRSRSTAACTSMRLTLRPTAGFAQAAARPDRLAAQMFTELPALLERRAAAE